MGRVTVSFLGVCAMALVALPGCGTHGIRTGFSGGAPQVAAPPDKVSALLAESADRAATALEELAAVEVVRTPPAPGATAPIADAPAHLMRATTVRWVGPAEPIVQALASRAGYTFATIGRAPAEGVIVSVDAENTPVIEVLCASTRPRKEWRSPMTRPKNARRLGHAKSGDRL